MGNRPSPLKSKNMATKKATKKATKPKPKEMTPADKVKYYKERLKQAVRPEDVDAYKSLIEFWSEQK